MPKISRNDELASSRLRAVKWTLLVFIVGVVLGGLFLLRSMRPSALQQPLTLQELMALTPEQLTTCDIARMNLLCADGLPGAEDLNLATCLQQLDSWAERVKTETELNFHRFQANPREFESSEPYFRMGMLVTILQQDCGVHYNPARIESPSAPVSSAVFFADSKDVFLHGLTGRRHMGTCASMPVLYVAVARRLGYPVYLVSAKDHLFVRWESPDGKERLNIEGTNRGINCFPDAYYKTWPAPISAAEIKACRYLQAMTPSETLAAFLSIRGACLQSAGRLPEARQAFAQAHALVPQSPVYAQALAFSGSGQSAPVGMMAVSRSRPSRTGIDATFAELAEVQALNRHNRAMMERNNAQLPSAQNPLNFPTTKILPDK